MGMKFNINITEALCGFKKAITTLDDRNLIIQTIPGECIKTGDLKCVYGEGMPTYRNPFEKGKLIIQFNVEFPESLDPEADRRQRRSAMEDDEDHMHGHGPGVSCATQ